MLRKQITLLVLLVLVVFPNVSVAGQISGVLTDLTNPAQAIANAVISLNTGERVTSTETGGYTITGLAGGSYSLTVTAEGYYSRTYANLVLADASSSVIRNVKMIPLPAQSNIVTDDFNRPNNQDLGTTKAPQFLPWIPDPSQSEISDDKLWLGPADHHGVSLGGDFFPADVDITVKLGIYAGGGWAGIGYRQQMPNAFDAFNGQSAAQAGYVVYFTSDGTQIVLQRNSVIAAVNADPPVYAGEEHTVRVRATGSHHEVWVDGQKRIDASDPGKLTGGYVGIFSDAAFVSADDLSVGTYVAANTSIAAAKAASVGSEVAVLGKVISAQWSGSTMYVEEPDKSAGIKVVLLSPDADLYKKISTSVDVYGIRRVDTQTGEVYIESGDVSDTGGAKTFLTPEAMDNSKVNNKNLDITGLYAKVVGQVKTINGTSDFIINDGTSDLKVVINPAVGLKPWPQIGAVVEVEGIVSLAGVTPAGAVRCIRPWNSNINLFDVEARNPGFEAANPITLWGFGAYGGVNSALTFRTDYPHGGSTYARITNTSPLAGSVYSELYQIYVPSLSYVIMDTEYDLSCWVRGKNVVSTSGFGQMLCFWDPLLPNGRFAVPCPAGTYDWTKVSGTFRWDGYQYAGPEVINDFRFQLISQEPCEALDLDDFYWGFARGTVKQVTDPVYTPVSSISDLQTVPDNQPVELTGKLVTISSPTLGGTFYIEEPDRLHAIRCVLDASHSMVMGGRTVTVQGAIVTTETGERQIAGAVAKPAAPLPPVRPLFMTNKTVAGLPASQLGLLVKTTGKVSLPDPAVPGVFYLDDGSNVNLKVIGAVPNNEAFATVVGIRSCELIEGVVTPVLLAASVETIKSAVAITHFGGGNQIWLRAADCVARSNDGGTPNFTVDPIAAATALSGSALYFPTIPDSPASPTDPAQQLPWWAEYRIDAADLSSLTLGGSWGVWFRTTQPASSSVESDWLIVNGEPNFLDKSNPTEEDWAATLLKPNFAGTPGHVIMNNISQSGSGGNLFPYRWGWWSRASATDILHMPLKVIDGRVTFRIYEREAGATSARIDLICWSDRDSYKPTDADAAAVIAAGL